MLTLRDEPSDALVAVAPSAGRVFRVHVCTDDLRGAIVADLIRRIADLVHDWQVITTATAVPAGAAALNIYPAEPAQAIGSAHVRIGCTGGDGCHLLTGAFSTGSDVAPHDPLSLRLAVLGNRYRASLDLDEASIEAADAALQRWRAAVASWARSPGAPMAKEPVRAIVAALEDDLDSPLALQVLRDLEIDESVAPGAKFETFAYADRLLGLDLAREIR